MFLKHYQLLKEVNYSVAVIYNVIIFNYSKKKLIKKIFYFFFYSVEKFEIFLLFFILKYYNIRIK